MAGRLKRAALIVLAAGTVISLAALGLYVSSRVRLNARINVPAGGVDVRTDITAIQRGQHIVGAIALCTRCHGPTLSGGVVFDDRMARVVAPDLTRGGVGTTYSDADYVRAIRYGVDPSGRQLWSMPTDDYNHLSDDDLAAVIAFLKSLPAIDGALPPSQLRPLGRVLFAVGLLDLLPGENIDRSAPRPPAVPIDLTPAYGQYTLTVAGCARCHGPGLSGGNVPGAPPGTPQASNLTPSGIGNWTEADFLRAMRTGRRPDGSQIDSAMPWQFYAQMTDLELRAVWQYLGVVPPRPTGSH